METAVVVQLLSIETATVELDKHQILVDSTKDSSDVIAQIRVTVLQYIWG